MTYSTWKTMRKMNTHKTTRILEGLEKKVKLRKMIEQKMKNEAKMKRAIQLGIRSVHNEPNRYKAGHAVDVLKYGVDRVGWA